MSPAIRREDPGLTEADQENQASARDGEHHRAITLTVLSLVYT